jgi:hypothetical protein
MEVNVVLIGIFFGDDNCSVGMEMEFYDFKGTV